MTSSLVGSEMCIRDRFLQRTASVYRLRRRINRLLASRHHLLGQVLHPVSYTHLTLPTICSV
eukprot:3262724-Prorocentrum_lima.AAC.1